MEKTLKIAHEHLKKSRWTGGKYRMVKEIQRRFGKFGMPVEWKWNTQSELNKLFLNRLDFISTKTCYYNNDQMTVLQLKKRLLSH